MKRALSYKKHKQHKQQRKITKKNKNKKHGRHMKGGDFSQEEKEQLLNIGFTNDQLVHLAEIASINEIQNRFNSLNGNITPADIAELVTYRLLNMGDWQNTNNLNDLSSIHGDDDNTIAIDDISFSSDDTDANTDANTDNEDNNTIGGKKRKSKKSKKSKKSRKTKKTRKQKGGMCYGTGVGANYNNPNYSIHNTELLELFPYKPK